MNRNQRSLLGLLAVAAITAAGLSASGGVAADSATEPADAPAASDRPTAPASGATDSGLWSTVSGRAARVADPGLIVVEGDVRADVLVDTEALRSVLDAAPLETEIAARRGSVVIDLPTPEGGFARFSVVEAPVMAPELAAKYPAIRTYKGVGVDDPTATVRLDLTPGGFHAQVLSPNGRWYIDPRNHLEPTVHTSYFAVDLVNPRSDYVEVGVLDHSGRLLSEEELQSSGAEHDHDAEHDAEHDAADHDAEHDAADHDAADHDAAGEDGHVEESAGREAERSGNKLVTYRLAVAATAEYTTVHGGTLPGAMAAIVTVVNRVTGVYEQEVAARFQLVANNDDIVFVGSDDFDNNNPGTLIGQSQTVIDSVIGNANYDIGHTFSTGAGGLATLGVLGLTGEKARGVTGIPNPVGDVFAIDYVAHEIGHQFGANHTFSGRLGSCSGRNGNSATAVEPGSGITIMAYANICGADNIATNSVPYFHTISYDEMRAVMAGVPAVGASASTGNAIPTVSSVGGSAFVIPVRTPFVLTATGADTDGDTLTYTWEQTDAGARRRLSSTSKSRGSLFTFVVPTTSRSRYFPALDTIAAGNTNAATGDCSVAVYLDCITEFLPTVPREMNFRVTVRDGSLLGGGLDSADVSVTAAGSTPFRLTSPNGGQTLPSRNDATVTWNVAGTASSPINTPKVDVLMSTDGGLTFPHVLATKVANDGSSPVRIPHLVGTTARLMIRGSGNIFFDTSDADFEIVEGTGVPAQPRNVQAAPGNRHARVSWAVPSDNGGFAVTRYTVTASPGGRTCSTTGALSCEITGLSNGTAYRFSVKATNSLGVSRASDSSAAVVPRTKPGAPRGIRVTAKNNALLVRWKAPASNGGSTITRYTAKASPGGKKCTASGSKRSCTIKKLKDSTRYSVKVTARNVAGAGPSSPRSQAVRTL
jgi:hypothetical protein